MFTHTLIAICFTTWAVLLWALLPKAYRLHVLQTKQVPVAFKQPVQKLWKPSALVTIAVLLLAFLKLSVS